MKPKHRTVKGKLSSMHVSTFNIIMFSKCQLFYCIHLQMPIYVSIAKADPEIARKRGFFHKPILKVHTTLEHSTIIKEAK